MPHALQPVPRAIPGPRVGVGGGEIGMRGSAPCFQEHARGPRRAAARGQEAPGDRSRRDEVRRKAVGFQGQFRGLVRIALLERLRPGREQDGPPARRVGLVDEIVAARDRQGFQRARPVAGPALQIEQRVDRPAEPGIARKGALGRVRRRSTFTAFSWERTDKAEDLRKAAGL